jgi:two-component system response regulator LytT
MVWLVCSPAVRDRLAIELETHGIPLGDEDGWALVERGFAVPDEYVAIVFDPLDHMRVVRLLASVARPDLDAPTAAGAPRAITGRSGSTFTVLAPRDVRWFEAAGDGIDACTATGRYRVRHTMQHYEAHWASLGFLRTNKAQIVNIAHVKEIVPWFNSRYVLRMAGGDELEVSKTYARRLREALNI